MEAIIEYIKQKYSPLSIIVYGSYAEGSNNYASDFDALVISAEQGLLHDTSVVDGIQLDVFVYPVSCFEGDYACDDFIRIFDGKIVADTDNIGAALQGRVLAYLHSRPAKTREELQADIDWCVKMSERAKRGDTEGVFRWHWLLVDSLEIFCEIKHQPYFGPKKSLKWMEEKYPAEYSCYKRALESFDRESLEGWISCIRI